MKTKPIGVRFDEEILKKLNGMGYPSPQKALNFLESFWVHNIEKVVEANNLPHHNKEIEERRNETPQFKNSLERRLWEIEQQQKTKK